MRGDLIVKTLELIIEGGVTGIDLSRAILQAGYGASTQKIYREFSKTERERCERKQIKGQKQKYYNLVYRLKKDGLIKEEENKKGFLRITKRGLEKLKKIKTRRLPETNYEKKESGLACIVIFDIPEREKRKRSWIRKALRGLGLAMVQRSVWIGKIKIPKDFLEDLRKLELLDCVEVFEAKKLGSLNLNT